MLRSIPARRAIRTLGSNSKWMESVANEGLEQSCEGGGGLDGGEEGNQRPGYGGGFTFCCYASERKS